MGVSLFANLTQTKLLTQLFPSLQICTQPFINKHMKTFQSFAF